MTDVMARPVSDELDLMELPVARLDDEEEDAWESDEEDWEDEDEWDDEDDWDDEEDDWDEEGDEWGEDEEWEDEEA